VRKSNILLMIADFSFFGHTHGFYSALNYRMDMLFHIPGKYREPNMPMILDNSIRSKNNRILVKK